MSIEEKWKAAQIKERGLNQPKSWDEGYEHFSKISQHYFEILGMKEDEQRKRSIIEIGCANFPCSMYFHGTNSALIYEPNHTEELKQSFKKMTNSGKVVEMAHFPFEQESITFFNWSRDKKASEAWLFNVLQHVIDPVKVIESCKKHARLVRFFEPIDMPTDECHLHTFNLEFYRQHFGDSVKLYEFENEKREGFHRQNCAYGTYIS